MTIYPNILLSAFGTGLGLIVAIGAQNIFIIKIGLQKRNVLLAATIAATCDMLLILFGTLFMGHLKQLIPDILPLIKWSGIIFLIYYGLNSLYNSLRAHPIGWDMHEKYAKSTSKVGQGVIVPTLAFSLLNPHVYLDTLLILGNLGSRLTYNEQTSFIIGAGGASYFWFYLTGFASRVSSRLLKNEIIIRIFDFIVAITMLLIAYLLFSSPLIK
ncbi:LysE/ArgO family amino acid transporter [Sodalis sp. RH15]|uniref:LysE/ArgO family amino acid transporter n=1 Tax=Sodalis sp. RH15 TaxID=3394330 RepID=UPI0039B5C3BD